MNCKISIKKDSWYPNPVSKFFSFCFALISEDFLGVGICLCGNNVGIAAEINFLFIGLSV